MKLRSIINNKKAQMQIDSGFAIVIFAFGFLTIVIIGFIVSMVVAVLDFSGDTITPVFQELGVVGDTNLTEAADYSVVVINNFVQALPWIMGFAYVCTLIFCIIFALSYEANPNPIFIGLFLMVMILILIGCIVISNMYEEIYNGDDEIGDRLQEQVLMSYMILYSPSIIAIIGFVTGIYMFSGSRNLGGNF